MAMINTKTMKHIDKKENRLFWYTLSKNFPIYTKTKTLFVNYEIKGDKKFMYTNDVELEETIHVSTIELVVSKKDFPFSFEIQTTVNRLKDSTLPKNYATDFIYDYFKKSKYPLRSSHIQLIQGRNMWVRLVKMALNDNYYVYYFDSERLHLANKDNIDEYINLYFGKGFDYAKKHLFISKKALTL